MTPIRMTSEPNASAQDMDIIENAINEFNMAVTGDRNWKPIRIFLRDEAGQILGGITAEIWGGWMHIIYLWVSEDLRHGGYGTQLLEAAEKEALAFGCYHAYLETFSFQARPFYERSGYKVITEMPNYPPGYQHYILQKTLA